MVRDVRGTGTLVPEDLRWIPATTAGRVERILLHPGAHVASETVILELSNPELAQEVRDAQSQLAAAEAQLATRQIELDSALLTMQSAVTSLESEAREARLDADAEAQLSAKGLTSAISLRTKRARADNLEARLAVERERLALQRRSRPTQLATVQGEVDRQRAAVRLKQTSVEALRVRAGVSGVLQQVLVELGARVAPGANLVRVVDPARLRAELKVPETLAKDVQLGLRATIDTRNGVAKGRVARIDPAAAGGTVRVDVVFDGGLPAGARPDLTVDGTIEVDRLADVAFMKRPAVGEEGGTIQLFRLDGTGHAVRVPVTLGRVGVATAEVRAGLKPGDQVILSDMSAYDGADRVRIK
jgi:HlyD family secretion protein